MTAISQDVEEGNEQQDLGKEEIKVALGISAQDFKDSFIARKLPLKWLSSNES